MLIKRVVTALLAIPIILIILYAGRAGVFGLVLLTAMLTFVELLLLMRKISAKPWQQGASAIFGFVYVGAPFTVMVLIYDLKFGPVLLVCTLLATWIADTSAYATGRLMGRRSLAPAISPNKTVEGAAGSLVVTALAASAFLFMPVLSMAQRFIFGAVLALAALGGDLFESWLKRRAGVKDSGTILPGHGGFLDRVDSLLFTAPTSYLLLRLWI